MKGIFKVVILFFVALNSYGQVNLQTGSPTYSLPMFNWQDNKSRLNSIVALNYNSGNGLRVNDVASSVGQGWNLVAGGVITRMQVGEPDDQKANDGAFDDIRKFPNGYLYNQVSSTIGCPNAINRYPIFGEQNHLYKNHNAVVADREADYFGFQFNGRTGTFVLNKASFNGTTGQCTSIGDSKLIMTFQVDDNYLSNKNIRTTIKSFTIQDENGLIYRFNDGSKDLYSTVKVLKNNYCDENLVESKTQPVFENDAVYHEGAFEDNTNIIKPYVINSWYLAEIEDAFTHRKIIFSYENRTMNLFAGIDISTSYGGGKNYALLTHKKSITTSKAISTITFPDGHLVTFNYGKNRVDMVGDQALASVDVTYNTRPLSKFQLNTSYFILNRYGNPSNDYQRAFARLCLRSVVQYGADLKAFSQPYVFDYYLGGSSADDIVPAPFTPFKDVWGFYNGTNSSDIGNNAFDVSTILNSNPIPGLSYDQLRGLCFLSNYIDPKFNITKQGFAKNGLLKQITYPTGGSLTYLYEQNRAILVNQSAEQVVGGVHVATTKLVDPASSNDCSHPLVTNYQYQFDNSTVSSLWGIEVPNNHITSNSRNEFEGKYWYYKFPIHLGCDYDYKYPGILSREQAISLTSQQEFWTIFSQITDIIGAVTTIIDIVNLCANGTGILAVAIDAIAVLFEIGFTCLSDNFKESTTDLFYNSDLNAINPLPSQYWRVEVVQGSGDIGKTVFEFTNPYYGNNTYAIWQTANPARSSKQRYAYWAYGLPNKTTVYDKFNNKVKETENVYDYSKAKVSYSQNGNDFNSCKCLVQKSNSQKIDDWVNPSLSYATDADKAANYTISQTANPEIIADVYDIYTGRTELKTTYERAFDNTTQQMLETTTSYGYNSTNFQVNYIETTQSTGDKIYKEMTYSCDYTTGVLNVLNQNNVIAAPVVTSIYLLKCSTQQLASNSEKQTEELQGVTASIIRKGGPSLRDDNDTTVQPNMTLPGQNSSCVKYYLSSTVTEYAVLQDGEIKPYRTLVERTDKPINQIYWSFYTSPTDVLPAAFTEAQRFVYDATGNLIGMQDEGGHVISNIYDYDGKYVVASVINADAVLDKPAYTSFESGLGFGGWIINGASAIVSGGVTGSFSYPLTSGSLSASVNNNKPYKVTFWATNNNVTVTNGTLVKSAPTINGYTYYEYDVAQGTTNVTVSGTAAIDELRLYPATARMRTVAYDPLIGKIAESDENNRLTYYEYDELGRMRFIKDDNKNIVKMYEYNTKKAASCTPTYTNNLIQEYITKTCGTGYVGTQVLYTIPAGKYTSIISQEDVDMQVQNEIDGLGQAFADNPANGGQCLQIFYNDAMSQTFYKQCSLGQSGSAVTYSVPANKYSAYGTNAKARANKMAQDEINANGQAYANTNGSCPVNTSPIWRASVNPQTRCGTGANAGHIEQYFKDVNPNSATYGTWQWQTGPVDNNTCPIIIPVTINCTVNAQYNITMTNIATGISYQSTFTYYYANSNTLLFNVPPGNYNLTVCQANSFNSGFYFLQIGDNYNTYYASGVGCVSISNINLSTTSTFANIYINPMGQIE
jgi:hypothetical protein